MGAKHLTAFTAKEAPLICNCLNTVCHSHICIVGMIVLTIALIADQSNVLISCPLQGRVEGGMRCEEATTKEVSE